MLDVLDRACSHWGMAINGEKTKALTVGDHPGAADQTPITLQNCTLEDVTTFSYLKSQVEQTGEGSGYKDRESWDSAPDLKTKSHLQLYSLSRHTKMPVFRTLVMSILLYGAETWPVTKKDIRKLTTFHMRCLRDTTRSHPFRFWSLAKNARPPTYTPPSTLTVCTHSHQAPSPLNSVPPNSQFTSLHHEFSYMLIICMITIIPTQ